MIKYIKVIILSNFIFKKDTKIGELDAENDSFLSECFIRTQAYETLLEYEITSPKYNKRILVGRTGSGKSALLKQLSDERKIINYSISTEKTLFDHIYNNQFITSLLKQNINLTPLFKSLWLHVFLIEIINFTVKNENSHIWNQVIDFIKGKRGNKESKDKAVEYWQQFRDVFFQDPSLNTITEKLKNGLEGKFGISTSLSPINSDIKTSDFSENEKTIQKQTNEIVQKEIIARQQPIIEALKELCLKDSKKHIVITLDDLDQSWFTSNIIDYKFISALLDSIKFLTKIQNIKILISIRTDILEGVYKDLLKQREKDNSLILNLEWNQREIRALLDRRIEHLIKHEYAKSQIPDFAQIFQASIGNQTADNYIIERTMLRPRDAIDFVNFCFNQADGNTEITKEHVLEAEDKFYRSRKKALIDEWNTIYKNVKPLLDVLACLTDRDFNINKISDDTYEEITRVLYEGECDPDDEIIELITNPNTQSKKTVLKKLAQFWFKVGVIGIKSESSITYSSYEVHELDETDYSSSFIIHPLFFRHNMIKS